MLSNLVLGEAVLEVDLEAIQENFLTVTSLVSSATKVAAVVKSDAYGLGMLPVAESLHAAGCNFFFVANLHEAATLRAKLSDVDIAVFFDEYPNFYSIYIKERLLPVINNWQDIRTLAGLPEKQRYVLNVDTGFSRLGLSLLDVRDLYLSGFFEQRRPVAVMSHLACSDHSADQTNVLQRNRFRAAYELVKPEIGSLAASAGVWLGSAYHFGMVRIGSALYGLNNAGVSPNPLYSTIRLGAQVLDIREVAPREAVGYGATYRTKRASRLAIVGIGYRHGLPWSCAHRISARIEAHAAPVVGRISMEYITVDITDIPEQLCYRDTWVDILDEDFGPEQLAEAASVAPQEILIRLGSGCTRRYIHAPAPLITTAVSRRGDRPDHSAEVLSPN
jgi:alanine racemase